MINIASLYYFTLNERLSSTYKEGLLEVLKNISSYLHEEGLELKKIKKIVGKYECIGFEILGVGNIYLFQKRKLEVDVYYYPSFFCNIYIEKKYLQNSEDTKKIIFLLSNIFECFDEFEERNLMIEFHKDIEESINNKKEYQLRYDFININNISKLYPQKKISQELHDFIKLDLSIKSFSRIKYSYPDIYRILLLFIYNIFALQKSYISTDNELGEIQRFEQIHGEDMNVSISEERLKMNKISLEKTLEIYKANFETFIKLIIKG